MPQSSPGPRPRQEGDHAPASGRVPGTSGRRRGGRGRSKRPTAATTLPAPSVPSDEVTLADADRLRRRAHRLRSADDVAAWERSLDTARDRLAARRASVPTLRFAPDLPISAARDEIATAIADHQVVVVAGETGSGKTTQLPKICLELGRGVRGLIGHTQPRRIAARSVAARIADETETELGDRVGFAVRFDDRSSTTTLVKVMTDGILLREIRRDPLLLAYDTLIVDEAHERSLNIDFILGYLARLLPQRPDLKVIITSATIDPARFADHFATPDRPVPVISVSGRTYPVEIRYQPLPTTDPTDGGASNRDRERDVISAIRSAVDELSAHGPGDILVFLATEREIRDTADVLGTDPRREVLPLYSRLSAAQQQRVFATSTKRRIVLSTNVAETSLTVPGIRYVVDVGTARISRYSTRTKVQRLPVEPVSQASARQRAGRCGRVADGICIRLYSEADFDARPAFTEPEILRTNLASVILTMTASGLGDVGRFPFVDAPDPRAVRDGIGLLDELGAITGDANARTLTAVGRDMADLPIDPRWARMVVAGRDEGVLGEILVVVAALSLPDVRERPADARGAADSAHARFVVPGSDFLSILVLWRHLAEMREQLSGNQFRRACECEYLHWLRIREWRDLAAQLHQIAAEKWGSDASGPGRVPDVGEVTAADGAAVHRSLLTGLLGHVGVREGDAREFLGARGTRFVVFPGSSLARKPPRFVMAAEIVETSRLFARTVAAIEPEWAERIAGDLAKRSYSEPHWSIRRAAAVAYERVTLYGVPLVTRRPVAFGAIDPAVSRDLFIRSALVDGQWRTRHTFFARNRDLLDDARDLEDRTRRGDLVITDDALFDFYDNRIPQDVVSGAHFDTWWKRTRRESPDLLDLTPDDVADGHGVSAADFPDVWRQGEAELGLSYRFSPGSTHDGVTVRIPIALLPRVRSAGFDWLVPGLREELSVALMRTLPKSVRRSMGPVADIARHALSALTPRSEPLVTGLAREVSRLTGVNVVATDFDPSALPAHLTMSFVAVDDSGTEIARADSLAALHDDVRSQTSSAAAVERPPVVVHRGWTVDTIGALDNAVTETVAGQQVTGYPMLRDVGDGVVVDIGTDANAARAQTHTAIMRLLELSVPPLKPSAVNALATPDRLALTQSPYPSSADLLADCTRAAIIDSATDTIDVRDADAFAALQARVARDVPALARVILGQSADALTRVGTVRAELGRVGTQRAAADVADQLEHLVYDGFISDTPADHRQRLPVYLDAILVRLSRLPAATSFDSRAMDEIDRIVERWVRAVDRTSPARRDAVNDEIHWMVEELRIGLFAERIRPAYPVSVKRVSRAIDALTG